MKIPRPHFVKGGWGIFEANMPITVEDGLAGIDKGIKEIGYDALMDFMVREDKVVWIF